VVEGHESQDASDGTPQAASGARLSGSRLGVGKITGTCKRYQLTRESWCRQRA
jgi:hypothetical protein